MEAPNVYFDKDHHGNKINNAKTDTIAEANHDPLDIINRETVDDAVTYDTTLSQLPTPIEVGGIGTGENQNGKKVTEVIDELLFPLLPPEYVLPVISMTSDVTGNVEVGDNINITLTVNTTLNDSPQGTLPSPYEFTGNGIATAIDTVANNVTINGWTVEEFNSWNGKFRYDGAPLKQDTHGNDDATGQFAAGELNVILDITGIWGYFLFNELGDIAAWTTSTEVRTNGTKTVDALPSKIEFTVPADGQRTIQFALPDTPNIQVLKDGISIDNDFEKSTLLLDDLNGTGATKTYTVWRHENGIGYSVDAKYEIIIT